MIVSYATSFTQGFMTTQSCLPFSDKRKCLYAADGYIEELSLAELKELKALESKTPNKVDSKLSSFGSVGHKFSKQFPDGRWFDGVVVEILKNVGKCVCH